MKNSLFIILITINFSIEAQPNTAVGTQMVPNATEIPVIVTTKFINDYPNISPTWEMYGDNNFSAKYRNPNTNRERIIIYDKYGNTIQKIEEMNTKDYPEPIINYYKKDPKVEYIIWSAEDKNGNKTYYCPGKSDTIYFDKNGKRIIKDQNKSATKLSSNNKKQN